MVLLAGSWIAISGGISRVTIIITHNFGGGLITPFIITAHEPPSNIGAQIITNTILGVQSPYSIPYSSLYIDPFKRNPILTPATPSPRT